MVFINQKTFVCSVFSFFFFFGILCLKQYVPFFFLIVSYNSSPLKNLYSSMILISLPTGKINCFTVYTKK